MTLARVMIPLALLFTASRGRAESPHFEYLRDAHAFAERCAGDLAAGGRTLNLEQENFFLNPIARILKREVIDQDEGVDALLVALEVALGGMSDPNKPFSRNLAIGPTGVGKTELMRALVLALGGDPQRHLIRVDCGGLQQPHEISKLIGATAMYAGYGDIPLFHQSVLDARKLPLPLPNGGVRYINLVLFDELEKCAESVRNLLLSVLDDGIIELGDNSKSDFRDSMIMATSNLGAKTASRVIQAKRDRIAGLPIVSGEEKSVRDLTGRYDRKIRESAEKIYVDALTDQFTPEFINRWMSILYFYHLGPEQHVKIIQKFLARVQKTNFVSGLSKVGLMVEPSLRDSLITRGTNEEYGARPLDNLLTKEIRAPLSRLLTQSQLKDGDLVSADVDAEGKVDWKLRGQGLSRDGLRTFADLAYPGFDFSTFDWAAEHAKEKAKGARATIQVDAQVITTLGHAPDVLRHMYLQIPNSPVYYAVPGQHDTTVPAKFCEIGSQTYRITNRSDTRIDLKPEKLPANYADPKQFTIDEIKEWLQKSKSGELP